MIFLINIILALNNGSWNAPQETIAMLGGVRNIPFS